MIGGFEKYQTLTDEETVDGAPNRSVQDRIRQYELMDYLTKTSKILDIGCNRGYFGIAITDKVEEYVGIDPDYELLKFGMKEMINRQLWNVHYHHVKFEEYAAEMESFDVILSLAVHGYVDFVMNDYADKMYRLLRNNGIIVIEGHPEGYMDEPLKLNFLNELLRVHFKMVLLKQKKIKDRDNMRDLFIWQKIVI